jgi:hypothetical protein
MAQYPAQLVLKCKIFVKRTAVEATLNIQRTEWNRAVTEVPVAVRIWTRAKVAQSQTLLRTTRQLFEAIIASTRLRFVAAGMRRRIDAVMPYGEVFLRTLDQLIGNFRHRKLLAVVAGVAGLVLILILLLEISVRIELSKEAGNAAINATPAPEMPQKMAFEDAFAIQPTSSTLLQSFEQLGAPAAPPSAGYAQTLGQVFQEPVPLPRTRKPH